VGIFFSFDFLEGYLLDLCSFLWCGRICFYFCICFSSIFM